jgi:hypothetical protein
VRSLLSLAKTGASVISQYDPHCAISYATSGPIYLIIYDKLKYREAKAKPECADSLTCFTRAANTLSP